MEENNNKEFNSISGDGEKKEIKRVIKTYRDFAVNALEDKPTSLANMIIREKKKKQVKESGSVKNNKNMAMIVLSGILVFVGIGAVAAIVVVFGVKTQDMEDKKFSSVVLSSIDYDYKKMFILNDINSIKDAVDDTFDNSILPSGTIKNIFFTQKNDLGFAKQTTSKVFLETLDTRAPNQFIRNLGDKFSVGVVALDKNKPFLIFETINFDATYNNLLAWEKSILYDMGNLFRVNQKYFETEFSDIILSNKDVRAVLDKEGNLIFAYSFIDEHRIAFFTDNQVLKIILSNMKNFIQK